MSFATHSAATTWESTILSDVGSGATFAHQEERSPKRSRRRLSLVVGNATSSETEPKPPMPAETETANEGIDLLNAISFESEEDEVEVVIHVKRAMRRLPPGHRLRRLSPRRPFVRPDLLALDEDDEQ